MKWDSELINQIFFNWERNNLYLPGTHKEPTTPSHDMVGSFLVAVHFSMRPEQAKWATPRQNTSAQRQRANTGFHTGPALSWKPPLFRKRTPICPFLLSFATFSSTLSSMLINMTVMHLEHAPKQFNCATDAAKILLQQREFSFKLLSRVNTNRLPFFIMWFEVRAGYFIELYDTIFYTSMLDTFAVEKRYYILAWSQDRSS